MIEELPIIELSGSPKEMGEAFGESCRQEIEELYTFRMNSALRFAEERGRIINEDVVLDIAGKCLEPTEAYDPEAYDEFSGIAKAAGISLAQCFVVQGLTDLRDLLAFGPTSEEGGCSSFILGADRSSTGRMLLGQNWDMHTETMPYVRLVHRIPDEGPETWSLTTTGCLTLIGINAEGIAVGTTGLRATDVRVGVHYLTVLHRALRSRTLSEAVDSICRAPRSAAHYYFAAGPEGVAMGLECSAQIVKSFEVCSGYFVHCNHALSEEIAALQADDMPSTSSLHRQERLTQLMATHEGEISIEDLKRFLSDHEGAPDRCICVHDFDGINTDAAVILSPATREIHACRCQPHVGRWVKKKAVRSGSI